MKSVSVHNYSKDKYYPRVVQAIARILIRSDVVIPVDVLMETGNLTKKNYDSWHKGQVPYLESVFEDSLSKASRILRIIGFHVHDLNMVPRRTVYRQKGNGKRHLLRFSKSGNKRFQKRHVKLKTIYSYCKKRHYTPERELQLPKVGRNDPCPCGSGKKYKKCCLMRS